MLERLFNLEQYGDNLSRKLAREINKEKTENSVLLGQLMGYEDISEERRKQKEEELNLNINNLNIASEEFELIAKDFKEKAELWDMQLEIKDYKEKEISLIEKSSEINAFKEKIKIAEGANKVNPYVLSYEDTLKNISFTERELSQLKIKCEELDLKKNNLEEEWNKIREIKDNKLPEYKIQEEKIKDAIEDKKALIILENEIKETNNIIEVLLKKKKENEEKLTDCENRLKKGNELLKEKENHRDTLNIDSELKQDVQKGVVITNEYKNILKTIDDYNIKIDSINLVIKKT